MDPALCIPTPPPCMGFLLTWGAWACSVAHSLAPTATRPATGRLPQLAVAAPRGRQGPHHPGQSGRAPLCPFCCCHLCWAWKEPQYSQPVCLLRVSVLPQSMCMSVCLCLLSAYTVSLQSVFCATEWLCLLTTCHYLFRVSSDVIVS